MLLHFNYFAVSVHVAITATIGTEYDAFHQTYAINRATTGTGTSTIASLILCQLCILYATRKHARNEKSVQGFLFFRTSRYIKENAIKEKEALLSYRI
jgi:hypothetical protein